MIQSKTTITQSFCVVKNKMLIFQKNTNMPANRNALIRFKTIDKCLQNRFRKWTLDDLIEAEVIEEEKLQDPWQGDFEAKFSGKNVVIQSAGPDGEFGTEDDVSSEKRDEEDDS